MKFMVMLLFVIIALVCLVSDHFFLAILAGCIGVIASLLTDD